MAGPATTAWTRYLLSPALLAAISVGGLAPAKAIRPGDCDGDGNVAISELVTAVDISLGIAPLVRCRAADRNLDGRVSVDELVAAVREALDDQPPQQRAFIVTTNFQAGSFATIDLDTPRRVSPSSSQRRVHSDAVVRTHGGLIYVVNRLFGDNIQVLDPNDGFRTISQCSTGNGSNPRDIVVVSEDKAYVTRFEEPDLLVVNPHPKPDCSDFEIGSINLQSLADADGIPDMDQMAVVGTRLYVSLQRLDINTILRLPAGPGALAVIDTTSDTLIDSIELSGENPFAATKGLTVHNGKLYVSYSGEFEILDGGIERVDLATGRPEGIFATEAELGGDLTDFAIVSDRLIYAIVTRIAFSTALIAFDPQTPASPKTILEIDGFDLVDIELNDRGELYLADRSSNRDGIRIYRASDGSPIVKNPIDLGLAPFEIVFIR